MLTSVLETTMIWQRCPKKSGSMVISFLDYAKSRQNMIRTMCFPDVLKLHQNKTVNSLFSNVMNLLNEQFEIKLTNRNSTFLVSENNVVRY